ncbi:MAG: chemotaxis protein [Bacteroidota bacterium]|nr:chemotaxis protein [Bacteroidota bacterium]
MPEQDKKNLSNSALYVVGIGASAGGLDAINGLFENMPENTGFSFVIVQHLSPDHKSLMPELLSKHTVMPSVEAEDGMVLKPNHIYLLPSKKFITLQYGKIILQDKVKGPMPNNAVDVFFESLAKDKKEHAIGIVLSGTGSDGTKGIGEIKKHGGIVVVQDPVSAAFDGMPNSAIGTGMADLILTPDVVGEELVQYMNESPLVKSFHAETQKSEFILRDILLKIRNAINLDFSYYKRPTLFRRLAKRMSELSKLHIQDYHDYLDEHPEEIHIISQDFLINVSNFFRDQEAFEILRTKVIPEIMKNKQPEDNVKAWSVACSTGEEAYSVAILFKEYIDKNNLQDINIKIFATDIDKDALDTASRGVYSRNIAQDVSPEHLSKYFVAEGNTYKIHPDIRKMVVFSYHDIVKDPPFSRMDLISCRNMMIYISPEYQKEILKKLYFAMNVNGYLFLGPSENIGVLKDGVIEIEKKWKIYTCVTKIKLSDHDSMFSAVQKRTVSMPKPKNKNALLHIHDIFTESLLEEFKFGGVFINMDLEVKQAVGNYKEFIDFPETGFNFHLIKMVKPELSIALSIAIRKAISDNKPVVTRDIKLHEADRTKSITIIVKPYLQQKEYLQSFLFVVFKEEEKKDIAVPGEVTPSTDSELNVQELERELIETRTNLQLVIEEVETANEELQSANEEMLSSNEELQSTNEELQSLNEELHTVSAEHQLKIKELTELNDDLNNYFSNSDVGQILVDRKMIIRKFTPSVRRMINLIDTDINRSINDITTKIKNLDLAATIKEVMHSGNTFEKEIMLSDDAIILIRINPYLKQDKNTDGVVVNFIDITETKKLTSLLQAVFNSSPSAINAKRAIRDENNEIIDFEYIAANTMQERMINAAPGSLIGKRVSEFIPAGGSDLFAHFKKTVETGEPDQYLYFDEKNHRWFEIVLVKMMDGLVSISTDVTDKKKAEDVIAQSFENLKKTSSKLADINSQLERSNMDLLQFASVASHDLKEPLRKIQTFGNILQAKLNDRFKDGEINYVEKIIKSSNRMQLLIEDVLTLSKLSNQTIKFSKVDLNKLLNNIKDDLEISIKETNAVLSIGTLPVIDGVPGQMHQLFQNLISNAIKFNNKPEPLVEIMPEPVDDKIAEVLKINPDNYLCITIKDNGIGFENHFRDKIFGIFQRLNGNEFDGTGIGLAICKKIMDNHKGFITAESILGDGAEFLLIFPRI